MSEELHWGDEKQFQTKFNSCLGFCIFLFLVLGGMQLARMDEVSTLKRNYEELKAKEAWCAGFQEDQKLSQLNSLPELATEEEIEALRHEKVTILVKNGLTIGQISNTVVGQGKKEGIVEGMKMAESTAQVVGSWSQLYAALNGLKKGKLTSITSLQISKDQEKGLNARISYGIYFE